MPVNLTVQCPYCGDLSTIELPISVEQYFNILNRTKPIQNLEEAKLLTADQREAILTGICSDCWEEHKELE